VIVIYKVDAGHGPARASIVPGCCRVALVLGRGSVRQCSRTYTVLRTADGESIGMCKQHAAKWDAWMDARREPK
jgi:hypothetical protein